MAISLRTTTAMLLAVVVPAFAAAADTSARVQLQDAGGKALEVPELNSTFIVGSLADARPQCQTADQPPGASDTYRKLSAQLKDGKLYIDVSEEVMTGGRLAVFTEDQNGRHYLDCPRDSLLPVLAIMTTARYPKDDGTAQMQQAILVHHAQLSSLEPSTLGLRWDSDDAFTHKPYLDFTLSLKQPLTPFFTAPDFLKQASTKLVKTLVPRQDPILIQTFISFTGRFSQYIGTRASAPVVSRSFNPALFVRFWSTPERWFDLGYAHESNGQSNDIGNCYQYDPATNTNTPCYKNPNFDRGTISRGWDYVYANWQGNFGNSTLAQIELKQFLVHGLLQKDSEEYQMVEDGGTALKPRRLYDGIDLTLQRNLPD
ncbi:MAG TPA: hypothetical protein VMH83_04365, partial [Candidatus Acidoferrum sp.]|nr:hypothetical protein [Candidatus Acidoferrum sp.]